MPTSISTKCIEPKQMHDIVGHYNRFDIFGCRSIAVRRRLSASPRLPKRRSRVNQRAANRAGPASGGIA